MLISSLPSAARKHPVVSVFERKEIRRSVASVIVCYPPLCGSRIADDRRLAPVMAIANLVFGARHVKNRDRDAIVSIVEIGRKCGITAHRDARPDPAIRAIVMQ